MKAATQQGKESPQYSQAEEAAKDQRVIVIGAGPAGLAAAHELTRFKVSCVVLEKDNKVGGISRTESYKGCRFDMGGHRFFTMVQEVEQLWREALPDDFLRRPRISRIYYRGNFFRYPLKPLDALFGLGLWQTVLIVPSYVRWQLFPHRKEDTFEQWVTNRFGRRLFNIFFESYTEKVWGIPCSKLKAEWAAQRIGGLSLRTAFLSMFFKPRRTIKTLIDQFDYPRLGPGMMWEAIKGRVETQGGEVRMNAEVVEIRRCGNRVDGVVVSRDGHKEIVWGTHFISSMPISEFIEKLKPAPPHHVLSAASRLSHRDFLTVCLIVNAPNLFPDDWVYVHDPTVKVGRIQNFKNWSAQMLPDPSKTTLGLEYFCTRGDELWSMSDADLIELGKREVDHIGLASYKDIEDGCVFRVVKAYPVYDSNYQADLPTIRRFIEQLENFQAIGRNGLHRYNNQDHAMLTGMLAARNLALGEKNCLWSVNTDSRSSSPSITAAII
ncbi:MAG: NAD(P)/FAD-dependent oxidoreductase [Chloroflexota bacterium]|nr:MAG: NAD(P)/FAD-dependent oxidoreductase [Chloroflexota bacterium]